jgi:hypothetical protein
VPLATVVSLGTGVRVRLATRSLARSSASLWVVAMHMTIDVLLVRVWAGGRAVACFSMIRPCSKISPPPYANRLAPLERARQAVVGGLGINGSTSSPGVLRAAGSRTSRREPLCWQASVVPPLTAGGVCSRLGSGTTLLLKIGSPQTSTGDGAVPDTRPTPGAKGPHLPRWGSAARSG